ncbi:hypothetical protein MWU52_01530 [Jannaschia sp. S6380]|uniref:hypothetical protein n=1 Tax=Jannaschia sp. S6380 TaxID=2926408 RepID=UPI001FF533B2|nr:hypothetical protein [Jannaschia sp. S6380]MCK0166225.1 hypothetical protein [Jannaschia sp. S6380]
MRLPQPRVLAIDNEDDHLQPLVRALTRYGAACRPILFDGNIASMAPAPLARVIFTDLHLDSAATSTQSGNHFSMIQAILDQLAPDGPYLLVLWTRFEDDAPGLATYLRDRMQQGRPPFAILPLDKTTHMPSPNQFGPLDEIVNAIDALFDNNPQIAALLEWEDRVNAASAGTIIGVLKAAKSEDAPDLGRVLHDLAEGIAGKDKAAGRIGHYVAEALLPVLFDHLLRGDDADEKLWTAAVNGARDRNSSEDAAAHAHLNAFSHIDMQPCECSARGAVISLPDLVRERFSDHFGDFDEATLAAQFGVKPEEAPLEEWLLVQVRPACDEAQPRPGPLPYLLAREFTSNSRANSFGGLWRSPGYIRQGADGIRALAVSPRFGLSLPPDRLSGAVARFRLRNELVFDLIHAAGSHVSRPGIISYGKR